MTVRMGFYPVIFFLFVFFFFEPLEILKYKIDDLVFIFIFLLEDSKKNETCLFFLVTLIT